MRLEDINLGTTSGIIIATMLVLEVIKASFIPEHKLFSKIPTFVYALIVSVFLVILASKVLHVLQGDLYQQIWKAATAAMASSGFYEWLRNGSKPIGDIK